MSGDRIGSGTFATVKRCTRKADKKEFAVKIIDKRHLTGRELVGLKDEIRILKSMEFPHVIKMADVFDDGRRVKMVLELCEGGDLFDQILKSPKRRFNEARSARVTTIVARSLKYLHTHFVVHRLVCCNVKNMKNMFFIFMYVCICFVVLFCFVL